MSARHPPSNSASFSTSVISFTRSSNIPTSCRGGTTATIYNVGRIPDGGQTGNFHYPLTVDGYRVVYKGYLADPDLQDARARWPFVAIWDNHEFSWQGRQSIVQAGGPPQPGQTVKVAANQAWFEYIPARVKAPSGSLDTFGTLAVKNVPIEKWDDSGLGIEPNNLTAINSLIAYRSLRYGRHLDLILTDQHSFCGDDPTDAEGVGKIYDPTFNGMFSEPAMIALDAGRTFNGGKRPAELSFGEHTHPESREVSPSRRTILGTNPSEKWFRWTSSVAPQQPGRDPGNSLVRSICGPTHKTFPLNRPSRSGRPTPSRRWGSGDDGSATTSVASLTTSSAIRRSPHSRLCPVTVTALAGDAASLLPPAKFEPVGISFVGGRLAGQPWDDGGVEHRLPTDYRSSVRCSW